MDTNRYAVSIQWGKGWHYFDCYFNTKEIAMTYAKAWIGKQPKKRKGAKPVVHLWYLLDTFRKEAA